MDKPNKKQGANLKRCRNSYIIFTSERRKALKYEFPKLSNPELVKKIAKEWKELSEEQREKYKAKEKLERENYETKKNEENISIKYKARFLKRPLRYRTPFMLYLRENKKKLQPEKDGNNIDRLRELGNYWKNSMPIEEKKAYFKKAEDDKERFYQELHNYVKTNLGNKKEPKKYKEKKIENFLKNISGRTKDRRFIGSLANKLLNSSNNDNKSAKKSKKMKCKAEDTSIGDFTGFSNGNGCGNENSEENKGVNEYKISNSQIFKIEKIQDKLLASKNVSFLDDLTKLEKNIENGTLEKKLSAKEQKKLLESRITMKDYRENLKYYKGLCKENSLNQGYLSNIPCNDSANADQRINWIYNNSNNYSNQSNKKTVPVTKAFISNSNYLNNQINNNLGKYKEQQHGNLYSQNYSTSYNRRKGSFRNDNISLPRESPGACEKTYQPYNTRGSILPHLNQMNHDSSNKMLNINTDAKFDNKSEIKRDLIDGFDDNPDADPDNFRIIHSLEIEENIKEEGNYYEENYYPNHI